MVQVSVIGPVTLPPLISVMLTLTASLLCAVSEMVCQSCGVSVMRPGLLAA